MSTLSSYPGYIPAMWIYLNSAWEGLGRIDWNPKIPLSPRNLNSFHESAPLMSILPQYKCEFNRLSNSF